MYSILSVATTITLLSSLFVCIRWGNVVCRGTIPTSLLTFCAILFTSGLDVGLIMFPLVEFPVYAQEAEYSFANPLAIEFGFWGFLVWAFYFLTTFYFCIVEPKVKLFEIKVVKVVNNLIIIATCAFTGFLFLDSVPDYIEGISAVEKFGLLIIELHTVKPKLVATNLGKTAATAYDATHGYSDQFILEVDVFNSIAKEAGLKPDERYSAKFPNNELATVSINLLKGK